MDSTQDELYFEDFIAPAFYDLHNIIQDERYTHYWLKGGRGSTKSSFISLEIIYGLLNDEKANAMVLRKVGAILKDTVYNQLLWAIDALGATDAYHCKLNPLEIVDIETGQRILFRGADEPRKIKSTKFKTGYCKYIWYEEVDEFHGMEEIRTINQSLLRGGESFCVFYSYNPPQSQRNWVNSEVLIPHPNRYVHHSTYLDVPEQWLGEQFFIEAEHLKKIKPEAHRHEYLGEVTGTGGEVFQNVTVREITQEEIAGFDKIYRGLDFGYASDPLHYAECYFDSTRRRLFIYGEIHQAGLKNRQAVTEIRKLNKNNGIITADSAEPRTISEFRELGLRISGAKKGPGSVDHGIKFLQDMEEIIIDPERCPNTAREFTGYELEKDREGNFKGSYPDKNNHAIDAVRYALESYIKKPTFSFE